MNDQNEFMTASKHPVNRWRLKVTKDRTVSIPTALKSQFDEINKFVKPLLDLTSSIVTFKELPYTYVNQDVPEFSAAMAKIPTIAYWIIKGIVLCISHAKLAYQYAASSIAAWKLPYLAKYINSIHDHLKKQLDTCNQLIDEKRKVEAYNSLLNISEIIHIDNITVLKALIYAKENLLPLFDGSSKKMVNLEVLRKKTVLLLISSLDISLDEISIHEQIYNEFSSRLSRGKKLDNLYEIVWIPIVDQSSMQWTESMQNKFKSIQSTVPWYTVHHPSLIGELTIKFIKERWHFSFIKPILVVLDPQGKVVNTNAFHMMWIWGSNAFPFTTLREEALWEEETWRLEFLVNGIDPTILNWIKKLLGYDKSGEGWAVLCKGPDVLINGHGTTVLTTLLEYEGTWKEKVDIQGFQISLKDHHDMLHRIEQRCCRFEVMSTATMFPETMKCPDCLRTMKKHITFACCHDDQNSTAAFY
ncbi:Protein SIEVE ELEMENT OCCLUSION B [Camellia lanceoleosa]|uniref:Protein SIEVE ELEMENT OCCLUSION B n=1 Tax=Camellia lanceoleosa TaxID=1840588 RepID=A0ACC0G2A3_9ERIC|nr:Protein SIEVE ELEMENT OCCLUSION B [Camellia lanceoleosa]